MAGVCGSPMTTGGDSPYAPTGWVGTPCVRSRRSSRRIRCCAGTGSWWRGSGPIRRGAPAVPVFLPRSDNSCCAWPGKIRRGLYANSGCPHECRPPDRALDDRAHPQGPRCVTSAEAPDVMADVFASALASDRGDRFLDDGGVDVARPRDVLHGVRH